MQKENTDNKKFIKWIYFIPVISIIIAIILTAAIFMYNGKRIYSQDIIQYEKNLIRLKKVESKDRINRIIQQIQINRKIMEEESKQNIKYMVDFAYKTIQSIYKRNKNLSRNQILKKIKKRLRDIRFFNDFSGYFFIYGMDGKCILLPIKPSFEGKNLLHFKDARGKEIVKMAIKQLKKTNEAFDSWYWYRPNSKIMKKKIGYFIEFKPLNIFIGSAFYEEDIIKKVKSIALKIIENYRYGKKGYVFAYDTHGVTISHIKKSLIGKNRMNLVINHRHILKEMIDGAKIDKNGYFINYKATLDPVTKKEAEKISFVKMVPKLNWVIGTGFYIGDIRKIADYKHDFLKKELDKIIVNIIVISVFIILFLSIIMIFISNKLKNIIISYENNLLEQYEETLEQKKIFKLLFEKSKDGIFLAKNGKFIACNEMAVEMFGAKNKEDLLSHNTLSLSPLYQPEGILSKTKILELVQETEQNGVYRCEWLAKKLNGVIFWIEVVVTAILVKNEIIFHTACRDITKRKEIEKALKTKEEELSFYARHDSLTNLPNRYMFGEIISNEILRSKRESKIFALVFIDLDGFKDINDLYGHDAGDELLIESALRFKEDTRETDYLFRFGGDEFVMLLTNCGDENDVGRVVAKLKRAFSHPFFIQNHYIKVGISMGIAIYPDDGLDNEELLRNADIAMYKAKEEGRNRYVFYQEKMYKRITKRHALEEDIKRAIGDDEFILYYQPQIDIIKHKIIGFEALIRWEKGDKLITPDKFIKMAEQTNLINQIGLIVIDKAMKFAVKLHNDKINIGRIAINLSDKQLKDKTLLEKIKQISKRNNCSNSLMEFEITEGFIMSDLKSSYTLLKNLRHEGFVISIDDFGTGYSSLSYLKKLPLDIIKIDQSFITDIPGFKEDEAIVSAIIELGKGLNLKVIAEGVENLEQKRFLLQKGCKIIQGYFYSKPIPEQNVVEFIKKFNRSKE